MASVTYEHVTKEFGSVVAVNDLNLQIDDKEFLVFVGPSGCGKTTALRLLAGLEELTKGTIKISERVVNDVPPKDRDIAMVFQSYALYPHLTVYENLAFGLKLRKTPKSEIKRRVGDAAEILGITDYMNRKPRQLSGGSASEWRLGGQSCASRRFSSSTNRSPTWMQNCALPCAPSLANFIIASRRPSSTLPTTRQKR